jgi:hypothetical protein
VNAHRFIPRLEEIEPRETPATGLTPAEVIGAANLADFYYHGTQAALTDTTFISQSANRAPTQAAAALIVSQAPGLADILNSYVVELRTEAAVAGPAAANFYAGLISHYTQEAAFAQQAGPQAQAVSGFITQFNAAGTSSTGTTTTGTTTPQLGSVTTTGTTTGTPTGITTTGTTTTGTTSGTDANAANSTGNTTETTNTTGSSGTAPGESGNAGSGPGTGIGTTQTSETTDGSTSTDQI